MLFRSRRGINCSRGDMKTLNSGIERMAEVTLELPLEDDHRMTAWYEGNSSGNFLGNH